MNPLNHSKIELPGRVPLFTRKGWTAFSGSALVRVPLCATHEFDSASRPLVAL
jgi:hypothetical protein